MAGFNLTAKLNLTGPYNIKPVVQSIQSQLSNIKTNINIGVNQGASNNIRGLTTSVNALSTALQSANTNAANLNTNLRNLSSAFSSSNSNVGQTAQQLNNLVKQTTQSSKVLKTATTDMERFGRESALAVKRAGAFAIATAGIFGLGRAISSGLSKALEFEKGIVKLIQVTKVSRDGLSGLTDEIDRLSIGLGTSSAEMLEVAKIFTQAGLSIQDTRVAMEAVAKSTLAPSFDSIINTTEGLIAVVGQFRDEMTGAGIGAKDFEKVLGSINRVSADFAVEADDIVSAIRKTGGVFAAASRGIGTPVEQLNELIAVFTSVRATTRESADTIATGLRTIFTRIQRPQTIQMLRDLGVELLDVEGKFVGPYQAIQRLGEAFNKIDTRSQIFASVTEELGGIRQIGKLIPAIKQYEEAQRALAVAKQGQNSLDEDAAVAQQSLANQLAKTREQFLKLTRDLFNTSSFQIMAKGALELAGGFIKVADSVKELIPLITAITAVKSLGAVNNFVGGFVGSFSNRQRRNQGGPIHLNTGGLVPGVGDHDSVPAQLTPGEFVIRKKAVESIGVQNLQKLNKGGMVQHFASGGKVITPEIQKLFPDYTDEQIARVRSNLNVPKSKLTDVEYNDTLKYRSLNQRQNPAAKGKYNIEITTPVGGLFFNDVPKSDFQIRNEIGFGSQVLNQANQNKMFTRIVEEKNLDIEKDQLGVVRLQSGYGFGIDDRAKGLFNNNLKTGIVDALYNTASEFAATTNKGKIPNLDGNLKQDYFNAIGGNGILGSMFEGFIGLYTQTADNIASKGASRTFDFQTSSGSGFQDLFGETFSAKGTQYADAKFTDNQDSRSDIVKKAFAGAAEGYLGFDVKKFAKGGAVSDTVPALLTPGEYVVNKKAAQRIGYDKLHQLNNADRIQGYATGGIVNDIGGGAVRHGRMLYASTNPPILPGNIQDARSTPASKAAFDKIYEPLAKEFRQTSQIVAILKQKIQDMIKAGQDTTSAEKSLSQEQEKLKTLMKIRGDVLNKATQAGMRALAEENKQRSDFIDSNLPQSSINQSNERRKYGFGRNRGVRASISNFVGRVRGFGDRFDVKSEEERDIISQRRDARLNRIQGAAFGALGIASLAQSYLPEAKTSAGAANRSAITGGSAGLSVGLQLGSALGPTGALLGGVIGAGVGVMEGFFTGFEEFEKGKALKDLDSAMKSASESLEKITSGKATEQDFTKFNKSIREASSAASQADLRQANSNNFSIGSLLDSYGFIGGTRRSVNALFSGQSTEQVFQQENVDRAVSEMRNSIDNARQSSGLISQAFLSNKKQQFLTTSERRELGLGSTEFEKEFKKLFAERTNGLGDSQEDKTKRENIKSRLETDLAEKYGREKENELIKTKRMAAEAEEASRVLSVTSKNLDLFAEGLTRAGSVLDNIASVKFNNIDSNIAALLDRSKGGSSVSNIQSVNPFKDILLSSQNDIKSAFKFIGDNSEGSQRLQTDILAGQKILQQLPQLIGNVSQITDLSQAGRLSPEITRLIGESGASNAVKDELFAKIQAILPNNIETSGKDIKDVRTELSNITDTLAPTIAKAAEQASKQFDLKQDRITSFRNQDFNIRQSQDTITNAVLNNNLQAQKELLKISEQRSGTVDVRGRLGLFNTEISNLTGGATRTEDIVNNIAKLEKVIQSQSDKPITQQSQKDIADLNNNRISLDKNRRALEILSKSTDRLTTIQDRFAEITQRNQATRDVTRRFLAGGIQERQQIGRSVQAAGAFIAGDVEQRKIMLELIKTNEGLAKSVFEGFDLIKGFGGNGAKKAIAAEDEINKVLGFGKIGFNPAAEENARKIQSQIIQEQTDASNALLNLGFAPLTAAMTANTKAMTEELPRLLRLSNQQIPGRASGGLIKGPGTGTSDSIPARLSHGEYVIKASSVNKIGAGVLSHINNTGELPGFAVGGGFKPGRLEELRLANKARYEKKTGTKLSKQNVNMLTSINNVERKNIIQKELDSYFDFANLDEQFAKEQVIRLIARKKKYELTDREKGFISKLTKDEKDFGSMLFKSQTPAIINGNKYNIGGVVGPGSSTSDSINALVSNGEYIMSAKSAGRIGVHNLDYMNRFGALPKFASGGLAGENKGGGQNMPQVDISGLTKALSGFNSGIADFTKSIDSLKQTKITGTFQHTVNVNINGGESLKQFVIGIVQENMKKVPDTAGLFDTQDRIEKNIA